MLGRFEAHQFRCFENVALELEGQSAGLVGPNASGKTSLLEGLHFLSYGRSFRVSDRRQLVRVGAAGFRLLANVDDLAGPATLMVRWDGTNLRAAINDRAASGVGELASRLRAHLIDPSIHRLVEGLPQERRRLLDTGVFHVEPTYLDQWRQFRRALKQRNAALRGRNPKREAQHWDCELCATGLRLDGARRSYVQQWSTTFRATAASFGLVDASLVYRQGWPSGADLLSSLGAHIERDVASGTTSCGPHRGDVRIMIGKETARYMISRGQQKLLASALVLGQMRLVELQGYRPLLLVDDAGAELDVDNLGKFLSVIGSLPAQLIVTATFPAALAALPALRLFHVKQDGVTQML